MFWKPATTTTSINIHVHIHWLFRLSDMLTYWTQCNAMKEGTRVHTMWHVVQCIAPLSLSLLCVHFLEETTTFFRKGASYSPIPCPSRCNKIHCNIDFVLFLRLFLHFFFFLNCGMEFQYEFELKIEFEFQIVSLALKFERNFWGTSLYASNNNTKTEMKFQ